jgi:hypothetical protein
MCDGREYWRLGYWQDNKEKSLSLGVFGTLPPASRQKKRDRSATHSVNSSRQHWNVAREALVEREILINFIHRNEPRVNT